MPLTLSSQSSGGRRSSPQESLIAAAIICVGFLVTLVMGFESTGYHHADDLTHFQMARWAWSSPKYLLHEWGRPGFTALYFIPSWFGWHGARAWSALLSAVTAWMGFRIAQHVGVRRAWLVPLFLYMQPRFFTLCLTTLTETALGFYLSIAVLLGLHKRWPAALAVFSLGLTARHEAVALAPVFLVAAWSDRLAVRRMWPIARAPLLVLVLSWATRSPTAVSNFLHPAGTGQYGSAPWYLFFCRSMEAFGPPVAALGYVGVRPVLRRRGGGLVVAVMGVYFVAEAAIKTFGMFDSGGYARFLVPIGPMWAIAAVAAWNRLTHSDGRIRVRTATAVAAALVLLLASMELCIRFFPKEVAEIENFDKAKLTIRCATLAIVLVTVALWLSAGGQRREDSGASTVWMRLALAGLQVVALYGICGVLRPGRAEQALDRELAWLREHGYGSRPVVTTEPWVDYRLGNAMSPDRPGFAMRIDRAPLGAIVIWDGKFSPYGEAPVKKNELTARDQDFRLLHAPPPPNDPQVLVFEKTAEGAVLHPSRP